MARYGRAPCAEHLSERHKVALRLGRMERRTSTTCLATHISEEGRLGIENSGDRQSCIYAAEEHGHEQKLGEVHVQRHMAQVAAEWRDLFVRRKGLDIDQRRHSALDVGREWRIKRL